MGVEERERDGDVERKEGEMRPSGKFPEGYLLGMVPHPELGDRSPYQLLRPSAGA